MDGHRSRRLTLCVVSAGVVGSLCYFAYTKLRQLKRQQQCDDDRWNDGFSHLLDKTEDVGDVASDVSLCETTYDDIDVTSGEVVLNVDQGNDESSLGRLVIDVDDDSSQSLGVEETGDDVQKRRKILLLGLEKSGKSCLLAKLSRNMSVNNEYVPTKGYNVVCISHDSTNISMWEIGGSPSYRAYWRNFCTTTDLVLFVVDASNEQDDLAEAKEYIFEVVTELEDGVDFHIVAATTSTTDPVTVQGLEAALGVKQLNIPVHSINLEYSPEDDAGSDIQTLLTCCLDKLT